MVLADDLASAAATAGNLAVKYGPPIIELVKNLWDKYKSNRGTKNVNLPI
jgi:hypothetical protein